jgi:hypothetical protein
MGQQAQIVLLRLRGQAAVAERLTRQRPKLAMAATAAHRAAEAVAVGAVSTLSLMAATVGPAHVAKFG